MTGRLIDERLEEHRRTAPPRGGAGAAVAPARAGARHLADRRLGAEHWDQRAVIGTTASTSCYGYPEDGGPRTTRIGSAGRIPTMSSTPGRISGAPSNAMGSYRPEYRLLLPNGKVRHVRESGMAYKDPDAPARMVGVNWDVTSDVMLARKAQAGQHADRSPQRRTRGGKGAHRVQFASRFADRPAQPPLSRRGARHCISRSSRRRASAPAFCTSTSTASSRSTTRSATPQATPCWCTPRAC